MKLIEWWQQAGARTAWLSPDLRAELSGDTEVLINALAPDLREIASALLLCQKTDYSHALERLNAHAFTDEFNGLASLLKARVYAEAGDFKNAGVELENAKNLSADPRIVAEVELLLSQDLDLADDVLENRGLCECEEWQRVLGDTCSFLPRDIQSQIRDKISTVSWLSDGGIVAMLCIVLDIKQREYPSALKLIEEAYPQSLSKGHLFLLRARVHHALDEFDEMLLCLKGAAELCDDVDMFQGVFDELSASTMARFEEKHVDKSPKIPFEVASEQRTDQMICNIVFPDFFSPSLIYIKPIFEGLKRDLETLGFKIFHCQKEKLGFNIFLGAHLLNEKQISKINRDTVIFNVEQIKDTFWQNQRKPYIELLIKNPVLDISQGNIEFINRNGGKAFLYRYRPYYRPSVNIINQDSGSKVVFVGSINERRREVFRSLNQQGINLEVIFGKTESQLDSALEGHTVMLNCHFYEEGQLETQRLGMALAKRMPVLNVVESIQDMEGYEFLQTCVFSTSLSNASKALENLVCSRSRIDFEKIESTWSQIALEDLRSAMSHLAEVNTKANILFAYTDRRQIGNMPPMATAHRSKNFAHFDCSTYPWQYGAETFLISDLLSKKRLGDNEWFGLLSWKFFHKTGWDLERLKQEIDSSYHSDVLIMNPMHFANSVHLNGFEQGEFSGHHDMLFLANKLGLTCIDKLCDPDLFVMCNYVVGKARFWLPFLSFLNRINLDAQRLCRTDIEFASKWFGTGNYTRDKKIELRIFFYERLLSYFLEFVASDDIKISVPSVSENDLEKKYKYYAKEVALGLFAKKQVYLNGDEKYKKIWAQYRDKWSGDKNIYFKLCELDDPRFDL